MQRHRTVILVLALAGCGFEMVPPEFMDGALKSEVLARYLVVQRSDQLASGSPILGEAGSLGRPGVPSVGVRASRVGGAMPRVGGTEISTSGVTPHSFATTSGNAVTVSLDAAMTFWRGLRVGGTHILGITGVGTLALLPETPISDFEVRGGGGGISPGWGVRTGLLEESRHTPGLGVTMSRQRIPRMSLATGALDTDDGGTMALEVTGIGGSLWRWRLAASKQFGKVAVIVGGGGDQLDTGVRFSAIATGPESGSFSGDRYLTSSRRLLFVGGTYRVGRFRLGGELGRLSGTPGKDGFSDPRLSGGDDAGANWSRTYLQLGVRVGNQ